MNTVEVSFTNSQPVHLLGEQNNPKQVWVLCHGYGQNAGEFLEPFKELDLADALFAFPESLSRFYHRGHGGRVVGSWMTRLYRQLDIGNQNEYLSAVWKFLEDKGFLKTAERKVGFGFSQGGATTARWADQNPDTADEVILWGCKFPPDLLDQHLGNFRDNRLVRSYIGNKDEFFPPEQLEELKKMFSNVKNLDWNIYDGGHSVDMEIVQEMIMN